VSNVLKSCVEFPPNNVFPVGPWVTGELRVNPWPGVQLAAINRHHVTRLGNVAAVFRPVFHHALALLEEVATPIGGLHSATDGVGYSPHKVSAKVDLTQLVANMQPYSITLFVCLTSGQLTRTCSVFRNNSATSLISTGFWRWAHPAAVMRSLGTLR
jgi:hypothetical protein